MLTIIFGAGASFDSSSDYKKDAYNNYLLAESCLPLAEALFSQRFAHIAKHLPLALSLISRLRRATHIEHELDIISTENALSVPEPLMKVRRYIHRVIDTAQTQWETATHRNTVYYEFIDTLQKWQEK